MADINAQIKRAARIAGVPERLFASLILHGERSYQGWQTSPAGAQGPAQLMPGTASYLSRKYGIDTSTYEGNLIGGAYYLREQLSAFGGNPRKAVAAYNAGPGAVQAGRMPSETRTYVSNVLGSLQGGGRVAMPVGRQDLPFIPAGMKGAPRPQEPLSRLTLHSPAPVDLTPLLGDNIGRIAQGWTPTEILRESTPQILSSWLRPSSVTETKLPGIPGIPGMPGIPEISGSDTVTNVRGQRRQIAGRVVPLDGKLIGTPYQGTHAKAFNVQGGSDNWASENAVDIAAPVGTPVKAVADGVIGPQFGSLGSGGRFAGLRLHLISRGNEFYYAHLSRYAQGIGPGTRVRRGQVIGYSGEANGVAHLHFAQAKGNPVGTVRRR